MVGGRRLLVVVLDDAADEAQVHPLLPTGPGCLTLVTSRSPLLGLEAARACELEVFDPGESVAMLARVVGEQRVRAEPQAAARIAALCGGLPLALRIAGSRLARRPNWTLKHLAGRLEDERGRLDELSAGDLAVRSSLALGYHALSDRERLLLRRLGALSAPDFAPWAASALLGAPADRLLEALAEAGLLQVRGLDATGRERYGWHDLTRLYAAERLAEEEGAPKGVLAVAVREILDRTRRARALLLPAEPGSGQTLAHTAEQAMVLATTQLRESARRLAFYLTPFFELGAHREDWRAAAEIGLRAARRMGHRHGEALLLRSTADLHLVEGRPVEAAGALQRALPPAEAGLDQRRPAEARERAERGLGLLRRLGDRLPEAAGLVVLARVAMVEGRPMSPAGPRRRRSGRFASTRTAGGRRGRC
ncbi:NB-ARC domain-containing protein [Streptosporangium sp. NBC_01810]|uniref:NB-ARC domain-containing protein n=1 Tax=Streptosporangium sp. NBC_01810 TaxID=2975951 RepID=UPI002DDB69D2|nr:NB-ARC domain-containing protein [Streptosporangium sp. NBC_01810]WSA27041.1 NB-ARC domain-containing protein [Streptosporangium sp. NBC_01810]